LFEELENINSKPLPYQFYTAKDLWTDEYTSQKMLEYHLNENVDAASRNKNFIERSVKWIADKFNIKNGFSICDFGCGPGLYATRFAELNANVTGIDFSKRSIDYARNIAAQKELQIEYINQNYLEYQTEEKYDLITMIMCDYCALSPQQRKVLLNIFSKILEPGGSILFDVYSLEAFNKREEQLIYEIDLLNKFWSPDKYYGFLNVFKYEEEKVMLDKYTIVEKEKTRLIYNWLQYFSVESLEKELEENNFKIHELYSDLAGSEFNFTNDEMGIISKRI